MEAIFSEVGEIQPLGLNLKPFILDPRPYIIGLKLNTVWMDGAPDCGRLSTPMNRRSKLYTDMQDFHSPIIPGA